MHRLSLLLAAAALLAPAAARAEHPALPLDPCRPAIAPAQGPRPGLHEYVGAMHEHSAYSDGYIGTTPSDYYRSGRCFGLDFLVGSDHSDFFATPVATSDECVSNVDLVSCAQADPYEPLNSFDKYGAARRQADAEQTSEFTAGAGFEWSSDRYGHINAYFGRNWTSWLVDGTATMQTFYDWVVRPAALGGGSDALLTFNHPGDKSVCGQIDVCAPEDDPGFNWDDFAYDARVDPQMVGIEVFNGTKDFGAYYPRALDRGWHVGAIGAEDKGHKRTDRWGSDDLAKTVIIARGRDRDALRDALRQRRSYATLGRGLRLDFTVDGRPMGSRIVRAASDELKIAGALRGWNGDAVLGDVHLDVITTGGAVAASSDHDQLDTRIPAAGDWYFLRATRDGHVVAYSSPVWVQRS